MKFHQRSVTCLVGVVLCIIPCSAVLAKDGEKTDAKVRRLIDKLASVNKPLPEDDGSGDVGPWPEEYRFEFQANVYDAADELLRIGTCAVPELLRHLKDDRYSVTFLSGTGATRNYSVGHECDRLVRLLLNAGVEPIWFGRGDGISYPRGNDELPEWWKKNGSRPLWELQREAIEQELPQARYLLEHPGDFQPDMKKYIDGLQANLAKLNETHEALSVKYPRRKMLKKRW